MTARSRLIIKKGRVHAPQLVGLVLLLVIGVCFFITLLTIARRYEQTVEEYFTDQRYADVTYYGAFEEADVSALFGQGSGILSGQRGGGLSAQGDGALADQGGGVLSAEGYGALSGQRGGAMAAGRTVRDYREGDRVFRVISLTEGVNVPHIYEGRLPETETECALLKRSARAMGLSVGDSITLEGRRLAISGLVASPEYVYMVQNERNMMAQPGHFAVAYVPEGFFTEGYNEIVVVAGDGLASEGVASGGVTANDSAASDTTANDHAANDLAANDLAANDHAANDLAANDHATNDPTANEAVANDPTANDHAANDSTANDPATNAPAANEPTASDPAAGTTAPGATATLSTPIGTTQSISRGKQLNYNLYRADLDQISSFAYIFPAVFAALITVVIYVMLTRTIQRDRRQIGTMKALGVSDRGIIRIYLSQFCLAALLGSLGGCLAAVPVSGVIIGIFASMFEVPTLSFAIYPGLWAGAVLFSVLLCAVSGLMALRAILPLLPAHALRPRMPKGGKRILLERIGPLLNHASFNTRYALKNALRNKGRFFAVVLGMCGSCALLAFSLGFFDSIGNTQAMYFEHFAAYDVIAGFDPILRIFDHPAAREMDESRKALTLPVDIRGESYILTITESGFDMVDIPAEALETGVIIPEYLAGRWGVRAGDSLMVNGHSALVSAVVPQYVGLSLYTGFDYAGTIASEIPPVYNTLYARSHDVAALSAFLQAHGIDFTTLDDDQTSFDSITESVSVLIWFMIGCAVILGFTVLYSVGMITLSAREHEYMFLGVMGYPGGRILAAHIKETVMQLLLAIPLGFGAGALLLDGIKGAFSGSNFVIAAAIYPRSYAAAGLAVMGVSAIMALVTYRHIGGLDIVEGLKAQED